MPEFYMIFARKVPEFYIIIARKHFPDFFSWGGGHVRCPRLLRLCLTALCVGVWCRPGSVIVDLDVDFSTNVTDDFINSVVPMIVHNLMQNNNSFTVDGIAYPAAIEMVFEREVPRMNGSLISADNVTACMSLCSNSLSRFVYSVYSMVDQMIEPWQNNHG